MFSNLQDFPHFDLDEDFTAIEPILKDQIELASTLHAEINDLFEDELESPTAIFIANGIEQSHKHSISNTQNLNQTQNNEITSPLSGCGSRTVSTKNSTLSIFSETSIDIESYLVTQQQQSQVQNTKMEIDNAPHEFNTLNRAITYSKKQIGNQSKLKRYRFRSRQPKNNEQKKYLTLEYLKDSRWSQEKIREISRYTGLTFSQVYKWHWDKRQEELCTYQHFYTHSFASQIAQLQESEPKELFKIMRTEKS